MYVKQCIFVHKLLVYTCRYVCSVHRTHLFTYICLVSMCILYSVSNSKARKCSFKEFSWTLKSLYKKERKFFYMHCQKKLCEYGFYINSF